ncbi:MAG: SIS domain-containing protein [Patescibacteria group bacterium]
MINLNNRVDLSEIDSQNMLGSIEKLGDQIIEINTLAKKFKLPAGYKKIDRAVVFGMGGSALGAHIIHSVFMPTLKVPLTIVNGYDAPGCINKNTLAIFSSYSGNTEEVIAAQKAVRKIGAKQVIICAGGELRKIAQKNKIPALIFSTDNNPCGSPRMGLGYSVAGIGLILSRAGLIKFRDEEIKKLVFAVGAAQEEFGVSAEDNVIKKLASKTMNRSVWFVGAGILGGNAHTAANQMNENAKRFAGYFLIPELNHHLMEGMMNPAGNKDNLLFVFFESSLYSEKIKKRFDITKNVLAENNIMYESILLKNKTALEIAGAALAASGYLSYYSAIVAGIDPTAIPFVDKFKAALKK